VKKCNQLINIYVQNTIMCINSMMEFHFYTLFNVNDGNTENAPVPDLHGCPNISLLEGDSISSFFPVQDKKI